MCCKYFGHSTDDKLQNILNGIYCIHHAPNIYFLPSAGILFACVSTVRRALQYPKYEYRLIMNICYAPKYNCYFALGKDFSVKVGLSKQFCFTRVGFSLKIVKPVYLF